MRNSNTTKMILKLIILLCNYFIIGLNKNKKKFNCRKRNIKCKKSIMCKDLDEIPPIFIFALI